MYVWPERESLLALASRVECFSNEFGPQRRFSRFNSLIPTADLLSGYSCGFDLPSPKQFHLFTPINLDTFTVHKFINYVMDAYIFFVHIHVCGCVQRTVHTAYVCYFPHLPCNFFGKPNRFITWCNVQRRIVILTFGFCARISHYAISWIS